MGIMKHLIGCMQAGSIKIMGMDGQSVKLPLPATVKDVLLDHPDHFIYDAETLQGLHAMGKARPLPAWAPLKAGQFYFLVPNPNSILNPTAHPCPLCNTLHCRHDQEQQQEEDVGDTDTDTKTDTDSDGDSGDSGDDKDGFSAAAKLAAADSQLEDMLASHCGSSGSFESAHGQYRAGCWKPSLDIIYEAEISA